MRVQARKNSSINIEQEEEKVMGKGEIENITEKVDHIYGELKDLSRSEYPFVSFTARIALYHLNALKVELGEIEFIQPE